MVLLDTLDFLAAQKLKDAEVLLRNQRNSGAIYLAGYSVEFLLKRKISITLGFTNGFPETSAELRTYIAQINQFHSLNTGIHLNDIRQIRNHRLNDLLMLSGAEPRIISRYYPEWLIVKVWNPENRYIRQRVSSIMAAAFVAAVKKIIQEIS
jgi:hypothetical protein